MALERGTPGFDAVFAAEYRRLVRSLTLISGDREVAADCVADAFERAYVRWHRIGQLEDPVGWIRRVAINRAIDVQRRSGVKQRALGILAGRAQTQAPSDTRLTEATAFLDSEVASAFGGLTTQQRAVVALHYLDDLAVIEVARALRISEGAVKYHLHQARNNLRTALDAPEVGGQDS
jgi:RNA polymerase sigma factor (sigma-70 family)